VKLQKEIGFFFLLSFRIRWCPPWAAFGVGGGGGGGGGHWLLIFFVGKTGHQACELQKKKSLLYMVWLNKET